MSRGFVGKLQIASERVSDGYAQSGSVVAAELEIVADEVIMNFRPHKNVVESIELDPASYMGQQVIGAGEIGAGEEATGKEGLIKADTLPAHAGLQFCCRLLAQRWSKNSIEIIKNRAERQEALGEIFGGPPGDLASNAKMMKQ